MLRGSCLCGAVTYAITGEPAEMGHCHCRMCRKAHGAAFATYARVAWTQFEWLGGRSEIATYASSAGISRTFCRICGSNLQFIREGRPHFALAVGTLDTDPGIRPSYQIWTSSRAPWGEPGADLASHERQAGAAPAGD